MKVTEERQGDKKIIGRGQCGAVKKAGQEEEEAGGWDEESEEGERQTARGSAFDLSLRPHLSSTKWDGRLDTEGCKAREWQAEIGGRVGGCFWWVGGEMMLHQWMFFSAKISTALPIYSWFRALNEPLMRCQWGHVYVHTSKHVGTHSYEHTNTHTQRQWMRVSERRFRFPVKSVIIGRFRSSSGMLLEWLRRSGHAVSNRQSTCQQ